MKKSKVIRLGLLMLLSQLVLTTFVVWWLGRQYSNEKTSLNKDLWRKFAETERQVSDSVIFKNYIEPLTLDTVTQIKRQFSMKTMPSTGINMMFTPDDTGQHNKTMVTFEINDSSTTHSSFPGHEVHIQSRKKVLSEMMVGLKMFIARTPGDTGELMLDYHMSVEADSGLFKSLFKEKIDAMGLNTAWTRKKDRQEGKMILYSSEFGNIPTVSIEGYRPYLLGKIWPQIAFGSLLVLLTATAFIIAYRSIRSQQKLNAIREDFISNISHELKTPLSTAKVTIEALKTFDQQKRAEVMHEYLSIAETELERLDELVTKVLHTGMLENENSFIRLRPVELNELVNEVMAAFRTRTKDRDVEIMTEIPGTFTLMLDPLHIHGVLYNLLDNAVKYNPGEHPQVKLVVGEEGDNIIVKVIDNGPGIHADYLDKVFDKFFRVPAGNVHNVKGHGLGLSYTQQVMHKHGGKVAVKNNEQGGCTFTLYFPKEGKR